MLFSYRATSANALGAIFGMLAATRMAGHDVQLGFYGNALIHKARNAALATARPDADYVLLIDDDMIPEPQALVKCIGHGAPVVSAACTTRVPPVRHVTLIYEEASDQFLQVEALRPGKLLRGKFAVGGAFLVLSRETLDALREYYLSARDWLADNRRLLDRLHVRTEYRERERAHKESLRRAQWEREKLLRVFDFPVNEAEVQLGEDIAFARKLLALGIPVAIDTEIAVGHLGEQVFGTWNLEGCEAREAA